MHLRQLSGVLASTLFIWGCSDSSGPPVKTDYKIEVRFFGRALTSAQQALFTTAAARLTAMIVGPLPLVNVDGLDVSGCTGKSTPPLSGTIDGLVIYASLDSIDGRSKTLAQSGPCAIRKTQAGGPDYRTAIGVMKFDTADVAPLIAQNALESTIVHEMLHVVGFGTFWEDKTLIVTSDTATARYIGPSGIAGCRAVGGTVTCASSVPIENCVGQSPCGAGQIFSHWRETTFRTELMTAYLNSGSDPLSVMTIRSLEDLNYTVNTAVADAYTIFIGARSASTSGAAAAVASGDWERPLPFKPIMLPTIHTSTGSTK